MAFYVAYTQWYTHIASLKLKPRCSYSAMPELTDNSHNFMAWIMYCFCVAGAAAPVRDTIKSTESFNRRTDTHTRSKKSEVEEAEQHGKSYLLTSLVVRHQSLTEILTCELLEMFFFLPERAAFSVSVCLCVLCVAL